MSELELEEVARETADLIGRREYLNDVRADLREIQDIVLSALKQVNKEEEKFCKRCGYQVGGIVCTRCGEPSASPETLSPQTNVVNEETGLTQCPFCGRRDSQKMYDLLYRIGKILMESQATNEPVNIDLIRREIDELLYPAPSPQRFA